MPTVRVAVACMPPDRVATWVIILVAEKHQWTFISYLRSPWLVVGHGEGCRGLSFEFSMLSWRC